MQAKDIQHPQKFSKWRKLSFTRFQWGSMVEMQPLRLAMWRLQFRHLGVSWLHTTSSTICKDMECKCRPVMPMAVSVFHSNWICLNAQFLTQKNTKTNTKSYSNYSKHVNQFQSITVHSCILFFYCEVWSFKWPYLEQNAGNRWWRWCAERPARGPLAAKCWMAVASLRRSEIGSRNVKSNVESDVDLSCSVLIFQQGLNLLLSPRSRRSAWTQRKRHLSSSKESRTHKKFHKWQNSFLSLSFPLSSPLFALPHPFPL